MDSTATICYGFKLTKDKNVEIDSDQLNKDGFELVYQGVELNTYLCIKESIIYSSAWDEEPVSITELATKPEWKNTLVQYAGKLRLRPGKIGWWLCCKE